MVRAVIPRRPACASELARDGLMGRRFPVVSDSHLTVSWKRPRSGPRQHDLEPRPAPLGVADPHTAVTQRDHVPHDRQAQPGTSGVSGTGLVEPGEAFKDPFPIGFGDTVAVVL